jgi:hypothetical protein
MPALPISFVIVWVRRILVALSMFGANHALGHGVSLDVHAPFPADSAFNAEFLTPWAEKVEKAAGGRIRLHLHPASLLLKEADPFDQAQQGKLDIAWMPLALAAGRFPNLMKWKAATAPADVESDSQALWEFARLNDVFDRDFNGVRVLALHFVKANAGTERPATLGLFVMSTASFKSLADDLRPAIDMNSGPEVCAWLARVFSKSQQ